jgi:hypothetical protein
MTDQQTEQIKMRPGMPLADRQALRASILEARLTEARQEAAELYVSLRCLMHLEHRAPKLSYDQRRAEHVKCQGESAGDGCLCEWHDDEIAKAEAKGGAS